MRIRLPGVCVICRAPVVWNGKRWRAPGRGMGRKHECPVDRPVCGVLMLRAGERCARGPGHTTPHRTAYSMENARQAKRMGWAA
jgi:hypothetical protein